MCLQEGLSLKCRRAPEDSLEYVGRSWSPVYTFDLMVRLVISSTDVNELSHTAHLAKSFAEIPQAVGMLMHAMIKHCMF
jgi:hypothetical protein